MSAPGFLFTLGQGPTAGTRVPNIEHHPEAPLSGTPCDALSPIDPDTGESWHCTLTTEHTGYAWRDPRWCNHHAAHVCCYCRRPWDALTDFGAPSPMFDPAGTVETALWDDETLKAGAR